MTDAAIEAEIVEPLPGDRLPLPVAVFDALCQLAAVWLLEKGKADFSLFPFAVDRIDQWRRPRPGEPLIARGRLRRHPTRVVGDWQVVDDGGRVVMAVSGLQQHYGPVARPLFELIFRPPTAGDSVGEPVELEGATVRLLAVDDLPQLEDDGIWNRAAERVVLARTELAQLASLPDRARRRVEWLLGRTAAKEAVRESLAGSRGRPPWRAIAIEPTEHGRPLATVLEAFRPAPAVSIAHTDGVAVGAAAVAAGVGVDIEAVDRVVGVGLHRGFSADELETLGTTDPQTLLPAWCAKEAAAKAAGTALGGAPRRFRVRPQGDRYTVDTDDRRFEVEVVRHRRWWIALCVI